MKFIQLKTAVRITAFVLAFAFIASAGFAAPQPPLPPKGQPGQNEEVQQGQNNEQKKPEQQNKNKPGQNQQPQQEPGQQAKPDLNIKPKKNGPQDQNNIEQNLTAHEKFEINEMRYRQGGILEIILGSKDMEWDKNERVIVKDAQGRAYDTRVIKIDRNKFELKIKGLKHGEKYMIEIPGVRIKSMTHSVNGHFWAKADWKFKK
jgi:hypothetical protein